MPYKNLLNYLSRVRARFFITEAFIQTARLFFAAFSLTVIVFFFLPKYILLFGLLITVCAVFVAILRFRFRPKLIDTARLADRVLTADDSFVSAVQLKEDPWIQAGHQDLYSGVLNRAGTAARHTDLRQALPFRLPNEFRFFHVPLIFFILGIIINAAEWKKTLPERQDLKKVGQKLEDHIKKLEAELDQLPQNTPAAKTEHHNLQKELETLFQLSRKIRDSRYGKKEAVAKLNRMAYQLQEKQRQKQAAIKAFKKIMGLNKRLDQKQFQKALEQTLKKFQQNQLSVKQKEQLKLLANQMQRQLTNQGQKRRGNREGNKEKNRPEERGGQKNGPSRPDPGSKNEKGGPSKKSSGGKVPDKEMSGQELRRLTDKLNAMKAGSQKLQKMMRESKMAAKHASRAGTGGKKKGKQPGRAAGTASTKHIYGKRNHISATGNKERIRTEMKTKDGKVIRSRLQTDNDPDPKDSERAIAESSKSSIQKNQKKADRVIYDPRIPIGYADKVRKYFESIRP